MRTITESESTPKADGFFMPAEFAPQDRVWMGWPHRTDTWAHGAKPAQKQYAAIARAIAEFTPVTMCANQADYANCKAVFEEDENVTVIEMTTDDAWFRDTAATYVINGKGEKRANHWHFNAYGGLVDGLYFPWDKDEQIALKMAELSGCRRYRPDDMILEGGSITVDGEGTLVVTDQCLLSPGRTCSAVLEEEEDPESIWPKFKKKFEPWSEELRAYMDEHLKDYLGVEKVIWVKEGIDPEETNGHIDDVATFIAPGVMACIWTDDPEYPFYEQCHAAYETLSNAVDAKGRKMKVYKLCMPVNPLFMDQASCDTIDADVVLTCGGSGLSLRDVTPEATQAVCDRNVPGIAEAMRAHSLAITPFAMLSRALCMQRGTHLVVNLPGSEKAARENWDGIVKALPHAVKMMAGGGH